MVRGMTHSESQRVLDQADPESMSWESICERAEKPQERPLRLARKPGGGLRGSKR